MPLKDYIVETKTINLAEGVSMTVQGLSFYHLSSIFLKFREPIEELLADADKRGMLEQDAVGGLVALAFERLPQALAEAAVLAEGEGADPSLFMQLPIVTQTEVVMTVLELTFKSEAEVKKIMARLLAALTKATDLALEVKKEIS